MSIKDTDTKVLTQPLSFYGNPEVDRGRENSFFALFTISDLRKYIFSFQSGTTMEKYKNLKSACKHGYLPIIEYMFEHNKDLKDLKDLKDWSYAINWTGSGGHLDVVCWLHERGLTCDKWAMSYASAYGHLDVVEWLHQNRRLYITSYGLGK